LLRTFFQKVLNWGGGATPHNSYPTQLPKKGGLILGLNVNNLTKSFGEKVAVDDISFHIDAPGVFGLIGTNGAGKTTTIRMILGIMRPDSGSSDWNKKPISRETLAFGYMPEERGIYMKSRVLEQLIYFGMLRGMNKTDANNSALSLMGRVGVLEYKDMFAEKLSKGNQQKIQLIATLIHNPTLLFLDEPFSGLDPINTETLRNLMGELVDEKKYIVMSSHQMSVVEEYCRDIVILNRGKTVLSGNLKQIKAGYGHTNLIIKVDDNHISHVRQLAENTSLSLYEDRADELEYLINGDAVAQEFLSTLVSDNIFPLKYEIKEPSLNAIFIEKVGGKV